MKIEAWREILSVHGHSSQMQTPQNIIQPLVFNKYSDKIFGNISINLE